MFNSYHYYILNEANPNLKLNKFKVIKNSIYNYSDRLRIKWRRNIDFTAATPLPCLVLQTHAHLSEYGIQETLIWNSISCSLMTLSSFLFKIVHHFILCASLDSRKKIFLTGFLLVFFLKSDNDLWKFVP
jgi:hypothetical protein